MYVCVCIYIVVVHILLVDQETKRVIKDNFEALGLTEMGENCMGSRLG